MNGILAPGMKMDEYVNLDTSIEVYVERGGFCISQISTLRDLLDINRIPYTVADVRPVVRGTWEKNGWSIRCSVCGYDMPFATRNFCPNCGAQMDGGKA